MKNSLLKPSHKARGDARKAQGTVVERNLRLDGAAQKGGKGNFRRPRWWSQTGSNRRPRACKARALPTELWPRQWTGAGHQTDKNRCIFCPPPTVHGGMVGLGRLELPTSRLSSARSNQLSYKPQAQAAPSALEPAESRVPGTSGQAPAEQRGPVQEERETKAAKPRKSGPFGRLF